MVVGFDSVSLNLIKTQINRNTIVRILIVTNEKSHSCYTTTVCEKKSVDLKVLKQWR